MEKNKATLEQIKDKVAQGLADLKAGKTIPADNLFNRLEEKHKERKA